MSTVREGAVKVLRLYKYGWTGNAGTAEGFVNDSTFQTVQNPFYIVPPGKVALVYVLKYYDNHPIQTGGQIFIGGKQTDLSGGAVASSKAITSIAGFNSIAPGEDPPKYWVLTEGERVFRISSLAWTSSIFSLLVFEYNSPS
jgi:hypothetical protein